MTLHNKKILCKVIFYLHNLKIDKWVLYKILENYKEIL